MNFISFLWIASFAGSFFSPQSFLKTVEPFHATFTIGVTSTESRIRTPLLSSQPIFAASLSAVLLRYSITMLPNDAKSQVRASENTLDPAQKLLGMLVRWTYKSHPLALQPKVTVVQWIRTAESNGTEQSSQLARSRSCSLLEQPQWASASTGDRTLFQIHVNDHLVAEVPSQTEANLIADQLRQLFQTDDDALANLQPAIVDGQPAGKVGDTVLFKVDSSLAHTLERNGELLAIAWVNELRMALDLEPFTLVEAQSLMYDLTRTDKTLEGSASWYGPRFHGRLTAAGETYDQNAMTAAHPSLPFNTYLKVTNLSNGKSVIVRINDRGPYVGRRSLDLSQEAARCLNSDRVGVVPYRAVVLQPGETGMTQTGSEPIMAWRKPEQRLASR
jgi:hypothetical protein